MSIKVVIDTNVFLGALLSRQGANRAFVRLCFKGVYQPLMGTSLFCEYEDVLSRPALRQKCLLSPAEQQDFLAAFMHICEWVRISYLWRPNLRDEKDNHLIELAVAGNAAYLVTHNIRDFQSMELRFPGLQIMRPTDITKED